MIEIIIIMYDCHNNSDSKNTIYGMEYIILYTKGLLITYTHTYIHTIHYYKCTSSIPVW